MSIRVTIASTGVGVDALTQKEGDGLQVAFENEAPLFLTWKSFRMLLAMRAGQGKPEAKPSAAAPTRPPMAKPVGSTHP